MTSNGWFKIQYGKVTRDMVGKGVETGRSCNLGEINLIRMYFWFLYTCGLQLFNNMHIYAWFYLISNRFLIASNFFFTFIVFLLYTLSFLFMCDRASTMQIFEESGANKVYKITCLIYIISSMKICSMIQNCCCFITLFHCLLENFCHKIWIFFLLVLFSNIFAYEIQNHTQTT